MFIFLFYYYLEYKVNQCDFASVRSTYMCTLLNVLQWLSKSASVTVA